MPHRMQPEPLNEEDLLEPVQYNPHPDLAANEEIKMDEEELQRREQQELQEAFQNDLETQREEQQKIWDMIQKNNQELQDQRDLAGAYYSPD